MADNNIEEIIKASEGRLVVLITGVKESLEREMTVRFDQIDARFEAQAARLERQAGLIQTGSRDIAKTHIWSDKMDSIIEGILRRLEKLEQAQGGENK